MLPALDTEALLKLQGCDGQCRLPGLGWLGAQTRNHTRLGMVSGSSIGHVIELTCQHPHHACILCMQPQHAAQMHGGPCIQPWPPRTLSTVDMTSWITLSFLEK